MESYLDMTEEDLDEEDGKEKKLRIKNATENLKRDEEENIVFKPSNYNETDIDVGEYASAHSWIELKNVRTQCLVKNFAYISLYDEFVENNGKEGIEISKYNNIIVPYIGSEIFNIETVEYLFARFSKGKQKIPVNPNIEYLITLDEKKNGEEVWEGWNIIVSNKGKDTLLFSRRLSEIVKFLELRYIPSHKIQEIKDEFIRQEIFKKAVEYRDNHNGNWSIGINGKRVRLFPAYDFDFCSNIRKVRNYQTIADNSLTDLKTFIKQYKDLPWMKTYISEVIQNFDMERIFEISYEKTKIKIPDEVREYFEDFYSKKKVELEQIFKEILQDKTKGEER